MESSKRFQQFFLSSVVPIICSVIVGFVFFGNDIFVTHLTTFQFIFSASLASLFYSLFIYFGPKRAYLGLLLLLVFTLAFTHDYTAILILRDVLHVAAIGVTIVVFVRYFKEGIETGYMRSAITLAGLFPIVMLVASKADLVLIRTFANEGREFTSFSMAPIALIWVLIGFAIGSGISITEKLFGPVEGPVREPAPNSSNNDVHS